MYNIVDTILLENIDKPASLFVFPTNVAASRWADHVLRLRGKSGHAGTVAMEKFIAWDTFKQNSIRSKVKNRQSIPSVLRKMFIVALIRENAELCAQGKTPIFLSLIRAEFAQQSDSSAAWLTEILPQLGAWFKQAAGLPIAQIGETIAMQAAANFAGDDKDLFELAFRYSQFIDRYGLFEPAWETPPFEDTGKECFIFFPESLSDFSEYRDLLAASSHVKMVYAESAPDKHSDVFFYTNSRSEIAEAALYILALRGNQNIPWDSISVSIPDDEHYGPYVLREFENRNIPYIKLSGKPLSSYPAGQFFAALAACASADFSFASIKELLLNRHLPWKNTDTIQALVEFGIKNNCISSWVELDKENGKQIQINVWEDAFDHPFGGINPQIRRFFGELKRRVNALCRADSFSEIRKHYFAFREYFLDMENCLDETDLILSRCISELAYLIEIEKSFPNVRVPDHYAFFAGYLQEVNYLAQQTASGVVILPYRTAAPAPFDCHIILGASQSSLSAVFSPLAFLPKSKREKFGITDNDASLAFINLHRFNSRLPAAFFCSEQTFSGYAIPHSALDAPAKPQQRYGQCGGQFAADLYREESNFYASLHFPAQGQADIPAAIPPEIHRSQKQGFEEWRLRRDFNSGDSGPTGGLADGMSLTPEHPLLQKIRDRF
ncbi:MAG: PD-(D/E)XK nuclease family protein, partial [Treponema sp.]|nr:PD-(D/E)XK nuclease family protein [Treponema sp.]